MSDVPKVRDLVGIAPGFQTEKEARQERERALQAEVERLREENERLREENQYLNDLYEANEFGIVQQAWEAEVERLGVEIARLRAKCNRLRDYIVKDIWVELEGRPNTPDGWREIEEELRLPSGDLDPEPHDTPQEPE